ncbi:MAG: hypothetical protein LBK77_07725 [Spirochaetaceae bacterium]|jgi:hypothetical protein|nr:hypothetical protein [Spirochaetaceae bacterium]
MKTVRACVLFTAASLTAACFSGPVSSVDFGPVPAYRERNSVAEIIDYENDMPEWVDRYAAAGLTGVETLPEFEDRYVFVSRQIGNTLEPLRLWAAGFSVERDFSRLVSARIQARFILGGNGNPGDAYGRYFEAAVKNASDSTFTGASLEGSFWIKKRIFADDGLSPVGEVYEYLIMTSINRETLRDQIDMLLTTTRTNESPSRDQAAASMRLRLNFYEGF